MIRRWNLSFVDGATNAILAFQGFYLALIVIGGVKLAGNTFFPSFLRFTIWITTKIVPQHSKLHHSLAFLLHHPRRCFILLFPSINTWYLTAIQASLHLGLWIFWFLLQIDYPTIISIPPGNRTISGLFQALGVRTAGMYIINMSEIAPALLVLYTGAMYISGLPIIISIRSTNVYEERSLGVQKPEQADDQNESEGSYIGVSMTLLGERYPLIFTDSLPKTTRLRRLVGLHQLLPHLHRRTRRTFNSISRFRPICCLLRHRLRIRYCRTEHRSPLRHIFFLWRLAYSE